MKSRYILVFLFINFYCENFAQSISFDRDTIQTLQNSDAGNVAAADIDLDGDIDLLVTGTATVQTTLYKNDGLGNLTLFAQPNIVDVYSGAAEFADVDNDGDQDLLITGNTSSPSTTVNLYLNDGIGNFTLAANIPFQPSNAGDIDFGDIDDDGDLDLIITGKNSADALMADLFINDGSGSFSPASSNPFIPVWFSSVEFFDVDNDNDLDVLICGEDGSQTATTTLYLNDGLGNFIIASNTVFTGCQQGDIAFGDTDNDGDVDVFISGINSNNQTIAELYINNNSSFSLLPNTPFPGASFHSAALEDFNNDGKLDLLHIGSASGGLVGYVYENMGSNNFILSDSTLAGSYNGENVTVDLNGDNKLDIVTTGTSFTMPNRAPKIYFNSTTISSGIENNKKKFMVSVFPNPTSNLLTINSNSTSFSEITLFDLKGNKLIQQRNFDQSFTIPLNVPAGMYFLKVKDNQSFQIQKVVVE